MKNLSINFGLSLVLFFSGLSIADPKILTCSAEWKGDRIYNEKWTALFDTDDFSKDNAQYEFTFLRYDPYAEMVGKTIRYPMSVTPSTISFTYCPMTDCEGTNAMYIGTKDVSRKDLTYPRYGSDIRGKCEIADYGAGNAL